MNSKIKKMNIEKKNISELTIEEIQKLKIIFFDFDGVFTNNTVIVSEEGKESVICYRGDGIGINQLKKYQYDICVISSEVNPLVKKRCEKLNIESYNAVKDKGLIIKKVLESKSLKKENAAFIGNDINDIPAYKSVFLKIAVNDRNHAIDKYVSFLTTLSGGKGAVREVCDKIVSLKKNL